MAVEGRVQFHTAAGRQITAVGLGGEGILRSTGRGPHALKVIREAVERGITYFDSAPAYQDSELYLGRNWYHRHEDFRGLALYPPQVEYFGCAPDPICLEPRDNGGDCRVCHT